MEQDSTKELLETLLHPVRMRVLTLLAGSAGMTPLQMAERLSDVPQATLYRHINRLAQAGLLQVVDERPVRGTLEKVYAVNRQAHTHLNAEDMAVLSKEEHLRFFTAFTVGLIDQYSHYLSRSERVDMAADGAGYGQLAVFMTDAELAQFSAALNQAILPYLQPAEPAGGEARKQRIFATIMIPDVSGKQEE